MSADKLVLTALSVEGFGEILGSDAPAPGGGSVAALAGSLGADLVSMVCALSKGREELADCEEMLSSTMAQAKELAARLMKSVDSDTEAFNGVMAAFRMPKNTDEEKQSRTKAIQAGYKEAVQSPFNIAQDCLAVLKLATNLIAKSNPNTLSDLGVGAEMAVTGLEGAVMNVRINLPSIKDTDFTVKTAEQAADMLSAGRTLRNSVYNYVQENL